jgi:hypothetical protein
LFLDDLTPAQKAAFVGHNLRVQINNTRLNDAALQVGIDKIAFYERAQELGLRVPATRALYHADRNLTGARPLADAEALADFLRTPSAYPFFAKPNSLSASVGTASAAGYHSASDEIQMSDGRRFPVDRLVTEMARYLRKGYLIQDRLSPHPDIAAIAGPVLSTVRMMCLDRGQGPELIRATWRVPAGGAQADVLWRGNLMADVDPLTGRAAVAVRGRGMSREAHESHPDSGALIAGAQLPRWDEARNLVLQAAACFPELPITGWDLAITDDGPVLIELEPDGGDPSVTQAASRRGLLEGPYGEFVRSLRRKR